MLTNEPQGLILFGVSKTCSKCKEKKPLSHFHKAGDRTSGVTSQCKICKNKSRQVFYQNHRDYEGFRRKRWNKENPEKVRLHKRNFYRKHKDRLTKAAPSHHRKHRYGLGEVEYQKLLQKQNNGCALCGQKKRLCVDHNHNTGKVRGLLCHGCNIDIRIFDRPVPELLKAWKYSQQ